MNSFTIYTKPLLIQQTDCSLFQRHSYIKKQTTQHLLFNWAASLLTHHQNKGGPILNFLRHFEVCNKAISMAASCGISTQPLYPFKSYRLFYVPPRLTFKNYERWLHCICFVWISEQTANFSLYIINRYMIYLSTAIVLTAGGSSTVHIYTQYIEQHK